MKLVDRLIFKAVKAAQDKADKLAHVLVRFDREKGVFVSDCTFWNGIPESGSRSLVAEYETLAEAEQAVYKIVEENNNTCVPIFLCRMPVV